MNVKIVLKFVFLFIAEVPTEIPTYHEVQPGYRLTDSSATEM